VFVHKLIAPGETWEYTRSPAVSFSIFVLPGAADERPRVTRIPQFQTDALDADDLGTGRLPVPVQGPSEGATGRVTARGRQPRPVNRSPARCSPFAYDPAARRAPSTGVGDCGFQTMRLISSPPSPLRLAVVTSLVTFICIVSLAAATRIVSPVHPHTIERHMAFLADDLLEGRKAGTRGYDLAAAYVAAQFRGFGLTAVTPDGYHQRVRFRTIKGRSATLAVRKGTGDVLLSLGHSFLLWGDPTAASADVSGEMIFIAYGICAPELGHDHYKGVDARGKILVFVSGVPPSFPAEANDYHSSPDLKARVALAKGAKAVVEVLTPPGDLLTHTAAPAPAGRRAAD
jgi:hypothetical protein